MLSVRKSKIVSYSFLCVCICGNQIILMQVIPTSVQSLIFDTHCLDLFVSHRLPSHPPPYVYVPVKVTVFKFRTTSKYISQLHSPPQLNPSLSSRTSTILTVLELSLRRQIKLETDVKVKSKNGNSQCYYHVHCLYS